MTAKKKDPLEWLRAEARFGQRREDKAAAQAALAEISSLQALNTELLGALQRVMANEVPLTGNPSHEELIEHWEYEKSQGRGIAEDMLFALRTIAKATGAAS